MFQEISELTDKEEIEEYNGYIEENQGVIVK